MRVLVKSPLNAFSGYGNDGIGLVMAMLRAGLDVYLHPIFVAPPLPPVIAQLLTKRNEAPFDLTIQHADPELLGLSDEARRAAAITVGWSMWEYATLDNLKPGARRTFKKRLKNFDLLLGYDTNSVQSFQRYLPKTVRSGILQGGFWPEDWPALRRDWHSERFGFAMVGALHQRKDPFVAINAFKELKDEHPEEFAGAELHLKTNTPGLHSKLEQWVPKLKVHYSVWPENVLRDFYGAQHVLIAPSRGEGKNMPALEMLSTGGTVIATNWGGHTQWLSGQYAYPLDYTLEPVAPTMPDCLSARASKDHLKELMLHVYRNRNEARRKGELAAEVIPRMCGWDSVLDRLFIKLKELPGGDRLLHQYRASKDAVAAKAGLAHV